MTARVLPFASPVHGGLEKPRQSARRRKNANESTRAPWSLQPPAGVAVTLRIDALAVARELAKIAAARKP